MAWLPCTRPPSSPRGSPSASRALEASLLVGPGPVQCVSLRMDRDVWVTGVAGPGEWWGLHGAQPCAQQVPPVLHPQWSLMFTPHGSQGPQGQAEVSPPLPPLPSLGLGHHVLAGQAHSEATAPHHQVSARASLSPCPCLQGGHSKGPAVPRGLALAGGGGLCRSLSPELGDAGPLPPLSPGQVQGAWSQFLPK